MAQLRDGWTSATVPFWDDVLGSGGQRGVHFFLERSDAEFFRDQAGYRMGIIKVTIPVDDLEIWSPYVREERYSDKRRLELAVPRAMLPVFNHYDRSWEL